MPADSSHILTENRDRVCCITINRPEKKNALTLSMYAALGRALDDADADEAVRVVYLTGAGDGFCSGNDVMDFLMSPPEDEAAPAFAFLRALCEARKPLVAAVSGPAIGVGVTMLLHCDLVYAAENARFRMPFTSLGLCPEAGSSLLIPRLVGHQRAAQYLLLGEEFNAATAHGFGLVNGVCPAESLHETAWAAVTRLAELPPNAVRTTKALLKKGYADQLRDTILDEGALFMQCLRSPETAEALQAFLQRRKPDFSAF